MPSRPKHPCSWPGCPNLTDGRFCPEHKKAERERYNKYERDPEITAKYGRSWKRIRNLYVSKHPLCERCLKEGRCTPVQEVHHIVPLSKGGTHDPDNLMSLCRSCHNKIHLEMGDRQIRK